MRVMNGAIYLVGGMSPDLELLNDVWVSTDGINWEELTPMAEFPSRS